MPNNCVNFSHSDTLDVVDVFTKLTVDQAASSRIP